VSSISNLVPSDVEIKCNTMTKRVSWNPADPSFGGKTWGVKNVFEIKSGQRMLLEGNIIENCWPSDPNVAGGPQFGCAILLTTRDENGAMPWATIQDITFRNNIIRHTNCGVSFYGSEGKGEHRIKFENNVFEDIGGKWGATDKTGRLFQATALDDLCFNHNTMLHTSNNILFAYGTVSNIIMTNNISQWFDGFQGTTFGGWEKNVFVGGKAAGFSASNYFPAAITNINFVNYANGDYRLASNSIYKNASTDGKDIGCDINALNAAINACSSVPTKTSDAESKKYPIVLYPNPNNGTFSVALNGMIKPKISIYDVFGRAVNAQITLGSNQCFIKMGDVLRGIYLLRIEDSGNILMIGRYMVE